MRYPLILLSILCQVATARVVYYGSEPESITVGYGGPTLFRMPSEVRTISQAQRFTIEPADPDQPNYALLKVTPRFMSGVSQVTFILSDGTPIRTRLVVSSKQNETIDNFYEFKSKESLLKDDEIKAGPGISEIELMKALIRGDSIVANYDIKNPVRVISPGFKGVTTTLIRRYAGDTLVGYIFEVKNVTSDKFLSINVPNLTLGDPNLAILSNVEPQVIRPDSRALLRIVAKSTSLYDQLILPIQIVEKKK